jgi:hypothetical protein
VGVVHMNNDITFLNEQLNKSLEAIHKAVLILEDDEPPPKGMSWGNKKTAMAKPWITAPAVVREIFLQRRW